MRQRVGDMWQLAGAEPDAWVVVPTNGALNAAGALVMGAGVALAASRRLPGLAVALGQHVSRHGNVPAAVPDHRVLSWPTKPASHDLDGRTHPGWMCVARISRPECERVVARLVWNGARGVLEAAEAAGVTGSIFLPHVGCGLGGLDWEKVGPALATVLDDRFVAVAAP